MPPSDGMPDLLTVLPIFNCLLDHYDPLTMIADVPRKHIVFLDETGL